MTQVKWVERVTRYQYLEPLISGRRVLEVGCGEGDSADWLAEHATEVVAVDTAPGSLEDARGRHVRGNLEFRLADGGRLNLEDRSFDLVLVPELQRWMTRGTLIPEIKRVLVPKGMAVFAVPSADAGAVNGLGYTDLLEYLGQGFEQLRLFGEIPFVGTIMADFEPEDDLEPVLECSLVEEDEPPRHYLAICSDEDVEAIGYTVVQIPAVESDDDLRVQRDELDRVRQQARQAESRADEWAEKAERATERSMDQEQRIEQLQVRVQQLETELSLARGAQIDPDVDLMAAHRELKEERDELVAELEQAKRQASEREEDPDREELQRKLADAERRVLEANTAARQELTALRRQIRDREESVASANEELQSVRAALEEARSQLRDAAGESRVEEELEETKRELQQNVEASRKRIAQLEVELSHARSGAARQRSEEPLLELRRLGETLNRQLEAERSRNERLLQRVEELGAEAGEERARAAATEQALEEARAVKAEQRERAEGAAELSKLHQRIAELQGLHQSERWKVDELTGRLREAEAKLAAGEQRGPAEVEAIVAAKRRIAELEAELARDETTAVEEISELEELAEQQKDELEKLNKSAMVWESRAVENERRATEAESQLAQLELRLKRAEAEAAALSRWSEELREELKEARGQSSARPATPEPEVEALRNDVARASQRIESLEARCDQLIEEVQRRTAQLKEAEERLAEALRAADGTLLSQLDELKVRADTAEGAERAAAEATKRAEELESRLRDTEQAETERAHAFAELERLRRRVADVDSAADELEQLRLQATRLEQSRRDVERLTAELKRLRAARRGKSEPVASEPVAEPASVDQRKLETLLKGAALHQEETAQLRGRLEEMGELVEELHGEHDGLVRRLEECFEQRRLESERAERFRHQLSEAGRELAQTKGELLQYQRS